VVINLKRFEFDYNRMQRLKVNDYCEFPERINFRRWTKEGIEEVERNTKEEKPTEEEDEMPEEIEEFKELKDEEPVSKPPSRSPKEGAIIDEDVDSDDAKSIDENGNMKCKQ